MDLPTARQIHGSLIHACAPPQHAWPERKAFHNVVPQRSRPPSRGHSFAQLCPRASWGPARA
eukprot:8740649-Pyramimonas_sp.AAC.1